MILILIILGVTLCVSGLFGLSIVIIIGFLIRKNSNHYSEEKKKATFNRLIVINYLALSLAAFGLIIIIVGILLG